MEDEGREQFAGKGCVADFADRFRLEHSGGSFGEGKSGPLDGRNVVIARPTRSDEGDGCAGVGAQEIEFRTSGQEIVEMCAVRIVLARADRNEICNAGKYRDHSYQGEQIGCRCPHVAGRGEGGAEDEQTEAQICEGISTCPFAFAIEMGRRRKDAASCQGLRPRLHGRIRARRLR